MIMGVVIGSRPSSRLMRAGREQTWRQGFMLLLGKTKKLVIYLIGVATVCA